MYSGGESWDFRAKNTVKADTIEAESVLTTSSEDLVVDLVTRFYEQCLGRLPDSAGLNGWVNALMDQSKAGADVAMGFVFSQEFLNINTTDEEYLTVLYEAFLNRQPYPAGW